MRINENDVFTVSQFKPLNRINEMIRLILLFPLALLGFVHCGPWYIVIKRFVEKTFKRPVFWGSVKLLLGTAVFGLVNIPYIFIFKSWIYPSTGLALIYYLGIGFYGLATYLWFSNLKRFTEKGKTAKADLSKIIAKRKSVSRRIHQEIPIS
jgi:drug/metabolite transporter (DMT)-like permease